MESMRRFIVALSIVVIEIMALRGQEARSTTLLTTEHYLDWVRLRDAQISPDGSRIVCTREYVNTLEDKWETETWMLNSDGSQQRFLVKGSNARWSPDGKRLLYLGDGEPKGSQIFVRWVDVDGPATQVTHVLETPRSLRWSPDGASIAFSMSSQNNHPQDIVRYNLRQPGHITKLTDVNADLLAGKQLAKIEEVGAPRPATRRSRAGS
jgi:Tol biopolymer transport system component